MTTIVFSKDRTMQLQAFLRSYERYVTPLCPIHVLYLATSARSEKAYNLLVNLYSSWAVLHQQSSFKEDVLKLVPTDGNVVFFVDDQIFIRPWAMVEEPGLSLRLAPHLTRCYTMNLPMPVPLFIGRREDRLEWRWAEGTLDWRYPLSLDGHVFDASEMRSLLKDIAFQTPNSLEAAMQVVLPTFLTRDGVCYKNAKVVNVPWNRVQKECPNRFGNGPTPEEMLDLWEAGLQIDLSGVYGVINESTHQEFEFRTETR